MPSGPSGCESVCRIMAVVSAAPGTLSDSQLLARFAVGERTVLEELFQRYRDSAYRVAYRLLGNEADALDAVQDGFVKALVHLDGFLGRSSFKTWLLRVVRNASLDMGRQRGRRELHAQLLRRRVQAAVRGRLYCDGRHPAVGAAAHVRRESAAGLYRLAA